MIRRALFTLVTMVLSLSAVAVHDAAAACSTSPGATSAVLARAPLAGVRDMPFAAAPASQVLQLDKIDKVVPSDIVGLWFTVFKIDDFVWNRGFQQYHAGNTELSVDSSVPPVLGNVCIGVWKRTGPRTFKLRHVTWNWNLDGSPAGTFLLITTVHLDEHGHAYAGTFESDSFDTDGNVIPDFHAEGTVTGRRITVD
jgi:hypothetical protein